MTDNPSLEDAIKTIAAGYRKERVRKTLKAVLVTMSFLGGISLVFVILGIAAAYESHTKRGTPWQDAVRTNALICGGAVLVFGAIFSWALRTSIMDLKATEQHKLASWETSPPEDHADELCDHGFYELALECYDKILAKLFEEAQKNDEVLLRFFDEYRTQERFVDGFPRPLPPFYHRNHDLHRFRWLIAKRALCLAGLGRDKEAQEVEDRLYAIRKIENEAKELMEKYWGQEYRNYYFD